MQIVLAQVLFVFLIAPIINTMIYMLLVIGTKNSSTSRNTNVKNSILTLQRPMNFCECDNDDDSAIVMSKRQKSIYNF